jgi:uncharacterized protein with HEPN domain
MSKTEDIVRIRHMADAARKTIELVKGCDRTDLDRNETLALAVVRLLEILGEAAKNVSEECRLNNPAIPWRQIAGTRDRLIHGYFDVDIDVVWKIISDDLPPLMKQLDDIILAAD